MNELLVKLSQGSHKAFREIFRSYYPKVHRFALLLLKNNDDADDAAQLVFMKVWGKRERFAEVNDIDSYLFTLTKYTVISYIASRRVFPLELDKVSSIPVGADPHEILVGNDMQLLIEMVVENMSPQRQAVYRMSREQNMKNDEIAAKLGISKKTVENHLNLALKDIKRALYVLILFTVNWV